MFDWDDMRVFATLAREGSLAGAARTLGVNHATVSRRVAALEEELGIRLVTRLARSTPLTAEGAAIAELATAMEDGAQAVLRKARDATATLSGKVTIATSPVLANRQERRTQAERGGMAVARQREFLELVGTGGKSQEAGQGQTGFRDKHGRWNARFRQCGTHRPETDRGGEQRGTREAGDRTDERMAER